MGKLCFGGEVGLCGEESAVRGLLAGACICEYLLAWTWFLLSMPYRQRTTSMNIKVHTRRTSTARAKRTAWGWVLSRSTVAGAFSGRTSAYCTLAVVFGCAMSDRMEANVRHEQRGPSTLFSVSALAHVQCRADFSPQEHLAWAALKNILAIRARKEWSCPAEYTYQAQPSPLFPQQVLGVGILMFEGVVYLFGNLVIW